MNRPEKNKNSSRIIAGFWRRQSTSSSTRGQRIFDVVFGILAPPLCFIFDPIVFRGGFFGSPLFPEYQSFAYMVSTIEILSLSIWLLCGRQLQLQTGLMGGMLMAGAVFCGVIGIVLLPFTLIGLLLGVGIFGFVPFLSALVFFRNGRGAFQMARVNPPGRAWIGPTVIAGVLAFAAPAGLNFVAATFVSQSLDAVLYADEKRADMAADEIKYLQFFARPDLSKVVAAYAAENEASRKQELKRRYMRLTGNDIEESLRIAAD